MYRGTYGIVYTISRIVSWSGHIVSALMATEIYNIGAGNGLIPDGTKPLLEPMLTDHQGSPVTFILGQFHKIYLNHQSLNLFENYLSKISCKFPRVNEFTLIFHSRDPARSQFCTYHNSRAVAIAELSCVKLRLIGSLYWSVSARKM